MKERVIHFHPTGALVALVGNPNCGKTALFNQLTGSQQKVANYAGVTVERREGRLLGSSTSSESAGLPLRILDLPGTYSLNPRSLDEKVTCDVLTGNYAGEKRPDYVVCVVDATNLRRNLRLVLATKRTGIPCVLALNMMDLALRQGIQIDPQALSRELGIPVISTVAVKSSGVQALRALLGDKSLLKSLAPIGILIRVADGNQANKLSSDHEVVSAILKRLHLDKIVPDTLTDRIDRVVLHPILGPIILAFTLFCIFQGVFAWAAAPMEFIKTSTAQIGGWVGALLPESLLRSLLVDGIIAGVGGVLVFLPQILILFFFILVLEESGYLPRAAFLLDRIMGSVGLSGRSFIPLLSSFACAIPGIMAARTIANSRDRIVTIMIAPLMTCSARLPVYALLIGAFIPPSLVWGAFELQGLVLFALYFAGILGAMLVAYVLKVFTRTGKLVRPLMMELPSYHWPTARGILMGLWQRVRIFMSRVGGVIMVLTILMWALASFPLPPEGATAAPITYSFAGILGRALAVIFEPIGFNWQISIALVPGMAAREVLVSALGTVYSLSATGDNAAKALVPLISKTWSMATAFSLLAWFVFAPQCLSTLATVRRETGGWKYPIIMAAYLFALAYFAAFVTYRIAMEFTLS